MEQKQNSWPKFYANQLIVGAGKIAVVTGWTKKEEVFKTLSAGSKQKIAVIGQLYSKEGINYIIRNVFLNPSITFIILTGKDLSKSLSELRSFLAGEKKSYIHEEISKDKLAEFINFFGKHFLFVEESNIDNFLKEVDLSTFPEKWTELPIDFASHIAKTNPKISFPSEKVGFRLEGATVPDVWLKVLDRIFKFGYVKNSSYGENQKELVNIITIINNDDPDNPKLAPFLNFSKEDLLNYYPQMMTDCTYEGVEYTYGSRLRNHDGKNQIELIIDELKSQNYSRRAIAFTWNVKKDCKNEKSPCLDLVQALIQGDFLYVTAYFRSNDMFRAWPLNAYGILKIQKEIATALNLKIGKLTIISCSAHIYERDFIEAEKTLKKFKPKLECEIDSRGNFVVEVLKEEIVVKHFDAAGIFLQEFKGKNLQGIREQIFAYITDISHALYLGAELQKAETALKTKGFYIQS